MPLDSRIREHEEAAGREDRAAACAATEQGERLHSALAEMHRHEAAKMASVRHTLQLAFGDKLPAASHADTPAECRPGPVG